MLLRIQHRELRRDLRNAERQWEIEWYSAFLEENWRAAKRGDAWATWNILRQLGGAKQREIKRESSSPPKSSETILQPYRRTSARLIPPAWNDCHLEGMRMSRRLWMKSPTMKKLTQPRRELSARRQMETKYAWRTSGTHLQKRGGGTGCGAAACGT